MAITLSTGRDVTDDQLRDVIQQIMREYIYNEDMSLDDAISTVTTDLYNTEESDGDLMELTGNEADEIVTAVREKARMAATGLMFSYSKINAEFVSKLTW